MNTRNFRIVLVLLGYLAGTGIAPAFARQRGVCPGGVFRATPLPLIDGTPAAEDGIIVLRDKKVSIGRSCAPTPASVRPGRNGTTISAQWRSCDGLTGPVRLVATIDASCNAVASGTLTATGVVKRFVADAFASDPSSMTGPPNDAVPRILSLRHPQDLVALAFFRVSGQLTCSVRDGNARITVPLPQVPIEIGGLGTTVTADDGSFLLLLGSAPPNSVHLKVSYDGPIYGGKLPDSLPNVGTRLQVMNDVHDTRSDELDRSGASTGGQNGQIIGADTSRCPWYDLCGLTTARGCSVCPPGFQNDGCTCRIDPVSSSSRLDLGTVELQSIDCDMWRLGAEALKDYHDVMHESPPAGQLRIMRASVPIGVHTFYDYIVVPYNMADVYPVDGRMTPGRDNGSRWGAIFHEFGHTVRHVASAGRNEANWDSDNLHYAYGHATSYDSLDNKAWAFNEGWGIYWAAARAGRTVPPGSFSDDNRDWHPYLVARRLQDLASTAGDATMVQVLKDNPGTILGLHDFEVRLSLEREQPIPSAPPACPPFFFDLPGTCYLGLPAQSIVKLSYGRGVGEPIDSCPEGTEYDWGLCYPPCDPGYSGHGPVCWDFPRSYGRGVGAPLTCAPNLEYDWGLCYTPCAPDYHGVGPVCWE